VHVGGYDPALLIRDAKKAGLLAMAALPVELYVRKRLHDAARREAARVQAAKATHPPVGNGTPPLLGVDSFGPQGGFGQDWHPDPGRTPGLPGQVGSGGFGTGTNAAAGSEERKHPEYLVEPDREGMFGSDALTAPPVIGDE